MKKPLLAIIVPCYNESEILINSYNKIHEILEKIKEKGLISDNSYICFVDDGSTDASWGILTSLKEKDSNLRGISFSKNFGHQKALFAGLVENNADIFITIDADLQDDLSLMEKMVEKYHQGCDIVYGVRKDRTKDSFAKRKIAESYYKLAQNLNVSGIYNHADYRLISHKITTLLKQSKEPFLYLRGLIPSYGFQSEMLYYSRKERIGGKPKYTFKKLADLAMSGIMSYSDFPLSFIFNFGGFLFTFSLLFSLIFFIFSIINHSFDETLFLIISIWFFAGIQLLCLGIVAKYTNNILEQTKNKPQYILKEKL